MRSSCCSIDTVPRIEIRIVRAGWRGMPAEIQRGAIRRPAHVTRAGAKPAIQTGDVAQSEWDRLGRCFEGRLAKRESSRCLSTNFGERDSQADRSDSRRTKTRSHQDTRREGEQGAWRGERQRCRGALDESEAAMGSGNYTCDTHDCCPRQSLHMNSATQRSQSGLLRHLIERRMRMHRNPDILGTPAILHRQHHLGHQV